MKRLISNFILSIFGILTIFGFNTNITKASINTESIKSISEATPLYLIHAKNIYSATNDMATWHSSHVSHASHASHESHVSHYSSS